MSLPALINHEVLTNINFVVCTVSTVVLINFRRNGAKYRFAPSFLAWVLIVSMGSVPLRVLTGDYVAIDVSETVTNAVVCLLLVASKGNVAKIFRGARDEIK